MRFWRVSKILVLVMAAVGVHPAAAQTISSSALYSCTFPSAATDCGFYMQAAASNRGTIVSTARDGSTAVELTTQPGDSNLYGSGTNERADLELAPSSSYCNQGQEEWWAHSVLFPTSYVVPPSGSTWNWGVVFDFHHTGSSGQPNFQIASLPTGLELWVAGGATIVNGASDPGFHRVAIGPVTKNVWYDFVYHVKWSSGSDGYFQAWLNGQQVMNYSGATLYLGESCYLKLGNYHTPLGVAVSVIHDRVVRGSTQSAVTITAQSTPPAPPAPPAPPPIRKVTHDFNGDGTSDLLWHNSTTGQSSLWLMNGAAALSQNTLVTVTDLNWQIAGSGDFDGDGKADVLWYNKASGQTQIWFMNGATIGTTGTLSNVMGGAWTVAAVGDFNGAGRASILWHNTSSGQNEVWLMNGTTVTSTAAIPGLSGKGWVVAGVGDFDGDGKADVLWRNLSTGEDAIFFMNGTTVRTVTYIMQVTDQNWAVAGIGDFDGDGKADILWRNKSTGQNAIMFMNGSTITSITYLASITDLTWTIANVGDFNGDGKADILWHNTGSGQNQVWLMNGAASQSTAYLSTLSSVWSLALH